MEFDDGGFTILATLVGYWTALSAYGQFYSYPGVAVQSMQAIPPGPRSSALVRAAPEDCLFYVEWAGRAEIRPGQKGLEGMLGDQEVKPYHKKMVATFQQLIKGEMVSQSPRLLAVDGTPLHGPAEVDKETKLLRKKIPLFLRMAFTRPGCIVAQCPTNAPEYQDLEIICILDSGDQANELEKSYLDLLTLKLGKEKTPRKLRYQASYDDNAFLGPMVHRHDRYFIWASNKKAIDATITRLNRQEKGLADNPRFQKVVAPLLKERFGTLYYMQPRHLAHYILLALDQMSASNWLEWGLQFYSQKFNPWESGRLRLAELVTTRYLINIASVDFAMASTMTDEGRYITRTSVTMNRPATGILSFLEGPALKPSDFAHVPADANIAYATSYNVREFYRQTYRTIYWTDNLTDEFDLSDLAKGLPKLEEKIGFSIEKELLPCFNGKLVVHSSENQGSFLLSDAVLALGVTNKKKLEQLAPGLTKLGQMILENMELKADDFQWRQKSFRGHTLWFAHPKTKMSLVCPCFLLTENQLFVTLHPQAMKALLRDGLKQKKHLGQVMNRLTQNQQGDVVQFYVGDSRALIEGLYPYALYYHQWYANKWRGANETVSLADFPSLRAIKPHLRRRSHTFLMRTKNGFYRERHSSAMTALAVPVMTLVGWAYPGF